MSNRNRTSGHNWERECVAILKEIYPNIVSSRSESKSRDDDKIDLMNKDEGRNGRLEFSFQCKNTSTKLDYIAELQKVKGDKPVILHKLTKKAGSKFITKGKLVVMDLDLFLHILKRYENGR